MMGSLTLVKNYFYELVLTVTMDYNVPLRICFMYITKSIVKVYMFVSQTVIRILLAIYKTVVFY